MNNSSMLISESITIQDQVTASIGDPLFILPYFLAMIAGLVFIGLLQFNKNFNTWVYRRLFSKKLSSTPYDHLEEEDVKYILSNVNNHYRILITVFGILLAFIVSDKISFALFNWNFIIWVGWVLGVIVRITWNMIGLSDIIERKISLNEVRFETYKNKQLIKHSFVLLVFGIAFLPSFMFLESPSEDKLDNLPWDRSVSILAGALGIISVTFGFAWVLGLAPNNVKNNVRLMYLSILILFILGSISSWSTLSPIEPKLVTFGFDVTLELPQIIVTIINFGAGAGGMILFFLLEMIDFKRHQRKQSNIK